MSANAADFIAARAARESAREAFETRRAAIRDDLEARGIGGRLADRIGSQAADFLDQGIDIADQHRGIVAGTIAALAVWFLRNPIIAALDAMFGSEDEDHASEED